MDGDTGRVVIVGPCGSGKSTLVESLRALGHYAAVSAQKHSDIPSLRRRSRPSALVALTVDLDTTARRRDRPWPAELHRRQRGRLRSATGEATTTIDTSAMTPLAVLAATTRVSREIGLLPARIEATDGHLPGDRD